MSGLMINVGKLDICFGVVGLVVQQHITLVIGFLVGSFHFSRQ